jgi:hypothetical protein
MVAIRHTALDAIALRVLLLIAISSASRASYLSLMSLMTRCYFQLVFGMACIRQRHNADRRTTKINALGFGDHRPMIVGSAGVFAEKEHQRMAINVRAGFEQLHINAHSERLCRFPAWHEASRKSTHQFEMRLTGPLAVRDGGWR